MGAGLVMAAATAASSSARSNQRHECCDSSSPDELHGHFVEDAPDEYLSMREATQSRGVSRQTMLQRVKHVQLDAVHVRAERRKGLLIRVPAPAQGLFEPPDQRKQQFEAASKRSVMCASMDPVVTVQVLATSWSQPRPGRPVAAV
jgi:hypothetical protein